MAFRISNDVLVFLNICIFFTLIPLMTNDDQLPAYCEKSLYEAYVSMLTFIMVVSIVGIVGFCFADTWLLWVYLVVKFLLIMILFSFIIFIFVVTNKGEGEAVSGRGFKEYKLGEHSNWFQKKVDSNENWAKIRACLVHTMPCQSLKVSKETYVEFYAKDLSPIQSGCCKPPSECNLQYVRPTVWKNNTMIKTSTNPDCLTWRNDVSSLCRDSKCMKRTNDVPSLCYDCQSCKAAVSVKLNASSQSMATVITIYLVFIMIVFALEYCAFRSNRRLPSHRE